jgi:uroporphyrinogen decarboxylase
MNSRERVLAAASRQRTDRPPTSLRCTGEAWEALRRHLDVATNDDVLDALDVDLRWVKLPFVGPPERSAVRFESEGADYWGCPIRKVGNEFGSYYEYYDFPLAEAKSVEEVDNHAWPSLDWWDYSAVAEAVRTANRREPRAIAFFAGCAFEMSWYLRGFEAFLMDLHERPEIPAAICRHVETYSREMTLRVLEAAESGIDVIVSGGDVGTERGMLLSPTVWRERVKPFSRGLVAPFRAMGLKTFYHSCGSILPVIDDLIEMGVDILDPIQVSAAGMDPEVISEKWGERLSFHGAIDVRFLARATPLEVYRETRRMIGILGRHGGYIVSPSHRVQGDTPAENVVAIYDAVRDYRWN